MSCRAGFVWETPQHFVRYIEECGVPCELVTPYMLAAPFFRGSFTCLIIPTGFANPAYCPAASGTSGLLRTVYADLWKMVATFSSLGQSWIKRTHTTGCRSPLPTGTSSSPGMLPAGIQHLHKHLSQTTILLTSNVTARFLHMAGLLPEIPAALPLL